MENYCGCFFLSAAESSFWSIFEDDFRAADGQDELLCRSVWHIIVRDKHVVAPWAREVTGT